MKRIATLFALALTVALAVPAAARVDAVYTADLQELNDSGATGHAVLQLRGDQLTVRLTVSGTEPGFPHLQHIHGFADTTEAECPPASADVNPVDGLVSVGEGSVFYGPEFVRTLSTTGAQEPLNLDIAPVANAGGAYTYSFTFTVDGDAADVADEAIVVHGLDLDGDGAYSSFMEASLPVLCGEIIRRS
ncbi:hypothetical protein [Microbacterium sp.]|uniref:hypothetical protein n=1 Tax=Microbacterium sp. TaxID=51671 RepID=UPI0031FED943|nr:hypothetical protein [Microbacterium sp.]